MILKMTPDIRRTIRECFPDDDSDAILSLLLETGNGLRHARSGVIYELMLQACVGNRRLLQGMVEFAKDDPSGFKIYIERFKLWQLKISSLQEIDSLHFFAEVLRRFALSACQYKFEWFASHYTIFTSDQNPFRSTCKLCFEPIPDQGVFITNAPDAKTFVGEIGDRCSGQFVGIQDASGLMLQCLDSVYKRDLAGPFA